LIFFLGSTYRLYHLSFEFHRVKLPWLHCHWWVAPVYPTSVLWIITFGGNTWSLITSWNRSQKLELKDAIQLTRSALTDKATDSVVKNYRKRLQACVSADGEHLKNIMW